jgi:glycosyltransferase involved in cell wall biosynthesis
MKKRILLCGEYSGLNSGYANWSRNLLQGLSKLNKYELAELACFCTVEELQKAKHASWKIYPNSVYPSDERYKSYKSNHDNIHGHWRFDPVCLDFKPDIVIDFRDPWMFEYQSYSPLRSFFKWVIMPPVDSAPQKNDWLTIFSSADLVIPYTQWAKNILKQYKNINLFNEISPAGIDPDVFKPLSINKDEIGIPKDKFVIGSVMRNQKRKLIPALFELISKIPDAILYLHTTYPEVSGWDIPSLLLQYNVANKVYFTYKCRLCNKFYASNYNGSSSTCKYCGKFSSSFASTSNGITDNELAQIYNTFNVYVQYAICEGFGMPQIEASSCGIKVFSVDYSAMSEVVRNILGTPLPLSNLQCELESHAQRAYPDVDKTVELIQNYRCNQDTFSSEIREATIAHYSWPDIVSVWEKAIDSIDLSKKKSWSDPNKYTVPNNFKLDQTLDNFNFVQTLCCDILKEPDLMKTQMIQHMLYSLDHGMQKKGSKNISFTKTDIMNHLHGFAQQKAACDHIRTTPGKIKEDYINEK